jgi:hypothetical protein
MEVFIIIVTQGGDRRIATLGPEMCKLQVSKTQSFTHLGLQSLRCRAPALPLHLRRGALKVLRSGLFEVSSNLEATTAMTVYAIEVFGSL